MWVQYIHSVNNEKRKVSTLRILTYSKHGNQVKNNQESSQHILVRKNSKIKIKTCGSLQFIVQMIRLQCVNYKPYLRPHPIAES